METIESNARNIERINAILEVHKQVSIELVEILMMKCYSKYTDEYERYEKIKELLHKQ